MVSVRGGQRVPSERGVRAYLGISRRHDRNALAADQHGRGDSVISGAWAPEDREVSQCAGLDPGGRGFGLSGGAVEIHVGAGTVVGRGAAPDARYRGNRRNGQRANQHGKNQC